jgi:L-alanine-DL-glutamate epimerase-like enolase superfamily enzyme
MKIESVDFFYFAMSEITTDVDGSQDALIVRVSGGGLVGWGECEAAPLPSIAAFVCPMSHGVCRPVGDSVLGENLESPDDIARIAALVEYQSMDLLQAMHTFSGVEMALWDLLGKKREVPVWNMLGYSKTYKKVPYASLLFANTPQETLEKARQALQDGFSAVKFGWGPIGTTNPKDDADQFMAAREGIGPDGNLMVDVGQIFGENVEAGAARLPDLDAANVLWLEEPFTVSAFEAYEELSQRGSRVRLAGGEGAHSLHMASHLMKYAGIGFIQIDCGRIGGIGPAKKVADIATGCGVTYVNHTFTSHLALSASLQPFAGLQDHKICEYPVAPKKLAQDLTTTKLEIDTNGEIAAPDAPGLGVSVNLERLAPYLVDVDIRVGGKSIYKTPPLT